MNSHGLWVHIKAPEYTPRPKSVHQGPRVQRKGRRYTSRAVSTHQGQWVHIEVPGSWRRHLCSSLFALGLTASGRDPKPLFYTLKQLFAFLFQAVFCPFFFGGGGLLSSALGMPLQEVMESFLRVAGGNNITGEASVVTNVVEQLFGILQDPCFTLSSGEADSWVTIAICNGRGGGLACVSLSQSTYASIWLAGCQMGARLAHCHILCFI